MNTINRNSMPENLRLKTQPEEQIINLVTEGNSETSE
jgi:hypothetical protein